MAFEIRIRWDGEAPGIEQHRLSLGAFGEALPQLLWALRRIATQMVTAAVEPERPASGRFANLARGLDIEITSIEGNSTGFNGVVSFMSPPDELPLFADLAERATVELLDSIDRESKGQPSNWAVRRYLDALPVGIHRQVYVLHDNGIEKKRLEISNVSLAEVPEEFPFLREVTGSIVGVGFEPGKPEVRVKGETSTTFFDASEDQVESALAIRHDVVRSIGVTAGKHSRLLRIERARAGHFAITNEAIEEHIFKRWSGVFARLAE
jgi:hypothetical protein